MNSGPQRDHAGRHQQAMLLMVAAMALLPGIDAIAKWLSESIASGQVAWSRMMFQALLLSPLVLRQRRPLIGPGMWIHAMRGALIAAATVCFFSALRYLPLADAISIFFVEPLILTLLSALFLGERIGWRRLSAVAAGFCGALVIIRPGFASFGWPALLPLATACIFATYLLLTRTLAQREDAARMQFFAGVFGCAVMTPVLAIGSVLGVHVLTPVWPELREWLLLALLGVIATTGHMLVVHAFARAPAGLLAPFQYLEIVSATLLGWVLFADFPDPLTWVGVGIVISAGLYVFHRERVANSRKPGKPGSDPG